MKKAYLVLILMMNFLSISAQEQQKYKLNTEIKILNISLERSLPNLYRNTEKKLIVVSFFRDEKNNCYLKKIYNTEDKEASYRILGDKIDSQIYENIVEMLKKLDVEKINYNFKIADGISYSLSFGDGKYSINLNTHTAGYNDKSDPELKIFLEIFDYVWNIVGE